MLADYHVHTDFSDDSQEPMENVIKQAIRSGIDELCFTDHVDYGIKFDHTYYHTLAPKEQEAIKDRLNVDYPTYFKTIKAYQEQYADKITLKAGLEFGMQIHTVPQYQKLTADYDLDFVILSCHQVGDKEFWNHQFQKGKTPDEYNACYYQEIYDCMHLFHDYSILGHLDMIQRYNKPLHPFANSRDIICRILTKAIEDNKGIEVNTSSFRYGLSDLMPAMEILTMYHELGGQIITVGSDCHRACDVGDRIEYVKGMLRKIGFKAFCTFSKKEPVFHDL